MQAAQNGHEAVVQLLLEHQADVNSTSKVPGGRGGRAGQGVAPILITTPAKPPPHAHGLAQGPALRCRQSLIRPSPCLQAGHSFRPVRSCPCDPDRLTGSQWMMIPPGPTQPAGSERTASVLRLPGLSHPAGTALRAHSGPARDNLSDSFSFQSFIALSALSPPFPRHTSRNPPKFLSFTSALAGRGHRPLLGCRGRPRGGGAAAARAQGRCQRGEPGAGQGWARGMRARWCLGLLRGRLACWSRAESVPPSMRWLAPPLAHPSASRCLHDPCDAPQRARARDEPTRPVPPSPSRQNLLLAPPNSGPARARVRQFGDTPLDAAISNGHTALADRLRVA
jgi:hypothetical protein